MVLDDDLKPVGLRSGDQLRESVRAALGLLVRASLSDRIHADRVAAERLRELEPLLVVRCELLPRRFLGRAAEPLAVAHDQHRLHPVVIEPLAQRRGEALLCDPRAVERVHELEPRDRELLARELAEVHRVGDHARALLGLAEPEAPVQRPLRERDRILCGRRLRLCCGRRGRLTERVRDEPTKRGESEDSKRVTTVHVASKRAWRSIDSCTLPQSAGEAKLG